MIKQQQQKQVFVEENMSNLTSAASGEVSVSSSNINRGEPNSSFYDPQHLYPDQSQSQDHDEQLQQPPSKKKRNLPGNPDPEAEVIALSPKSLLATNRFVCEICNKGFQRDQNLQLHRRGHNLPWKLKQRTNKDVIRKKVYVCPETSCVHHDPSRALGDLTGIKKHFSRKHGEKKWKCEKCSKKYAVQSDWKAHSKVCGTREYRCDCGTLFSRRDSFITHRAFCDALAEETARSTTSLVSNPIIVPNHLINQLSTQQEEQENPLHAYPMKREQHHQSNMVNLPPWLSCTPTLVGPSPSSTIDLSSPSSSSSIFIQDHQQPSSNPSRIGPTTSSSSARTSMNKYVPSLGAGSYHAQTSPHMSATALLQKAAQMGSTITKISDHQPQHFHHHHGHMSDTPPPPTPPPLPTTTPAGLFGLHLSSRDQFLARGPAPPSSASTYLNDLMINDESPFAAFHRTVGGHSDGNNKNNDGLTRDFLGLRPLSQSDIFTIAGFGNCMDNSNTTSSHNNHQNTH